MKKILLLFVAIMSFAIAANAQSDQCRITGGNGGYLTANVTKKMAYTAGVNEGCFYRIWINVRPSIQQITGGTVLCKIKYINNEDGEIVTQTATLDFQPFQEWANVVELDAPAKRILSIEIWGAECESVNRNNY